MTTKFIVNESTQGLVLYSDGGTIPNPGRGGYGIHGYLYSTEIPKKGSGNQDYLLTKKGYVPKLESVTKAMQVKPIHYIDGYGSFIENITNNVAEMMGAIMSLRHAAEFDITELNIFTDSRYVVDGFGSWAEKWRRNGWLKLDLSEPANVSYWKLMLEARDILIQRGVKVHISWVQSHTDDLDVPDIIGNILADKLATIGVMSSRAFKATAVMDIKAADGYWKPEADRHPFLINRRMYFNTLTDFNIPGEYYLGDHGKDDDMLGKRISDGVYAVVILKKPDPVLELIRDYQTDLAGNTDTIIMARLDKLYRPGTYDEISNYGTLAMCQENKYRLDLSCLDKEPLTREFKPPKLAMRAVDAVSGLFEKLTQYLEKDSTIVVTDITNVLFDTDSKTNKKGETSFTMKLKPEFNVGFAALPVEANYQSGDSIKTASVTLTLGIDILDRNALKRLDELLPKVSLISWLEAPEVFRYATIVEAGEDKGIWCSCYANLRIVTS